MKFLKYHSRRSYWSLSKFSKWIRLKAGLTNPLAETLEGWDKHETYCKAKSPVVHWITDKGFNKFQNIVYFIPDVWYSIRYADTWRFLRNIWLFRKALFRYRSYDYSGMLEFMETATKNVSKCIGEKGYGMNSKQISKDLKILSQLIKRVKSDDYTADKLEFVQTNKKNMLGGWEHIQKPNTLPNYKNIKSFYNLIGKQRENDWKLACKIMERKMLYFWD